MTEPARSTRPRPARLRLFVGVLVLAVVVWRVGTGPFLAGLRAVDPGALVLAAAIAAVTTTACAWRWRLVAGRFGVDLPLGTAVAAYYRSMLLNAVLPGGVLGDVHRAVRHGRDHGDVGRGVRAVVLERVAGQVVQLGLAAVALVVLPSPVRPYAPAGLAGLALVLGGVVGFAYRRRDTAARGARRLIGELAAVLGRRPTGPGVVGASVVVVVGQVATFVLAARTAGVAAPLGTLVALGLLALVAMGIPLAVAGFGPREGVAAWAFAAAGLGAAAGVAASVGYGVLAFGSVLPGVVVLLTRRRAHRPVAATAGVGKESAARG